MIIPVLTVAGKVLYSDIEIYFVTSNDWGFVMATPAMLINILEHEHMLDRDGLAALLTCADPGPLYRAADRVRQRAVGDAVHLRGLIEFSNYCGRTCFYCGLRAAHKAIARYRMSADEIIAGAAGAVRAGMKTIVLQSGEDSAFSLDQLCHIVRTIKELDVAITLSIGELSRDAYAALRRAGADRYLLRIETSNEDLYRRLHPGMSYRNRLRCLYDLRELGYEVGTGCLIGLPGQTTAMLADDLLLFKELGADMIGLGPFIPAAGTPLAHAPGGSVDVSLRMMALTRLLLPDINIPATTALGVKDHDGYEKGLRCGANVIMPNMGKQEYKKLYAIYPGKGTGVTNLENQLAVLEDIIRRQGRVIGRGYGQHLRRSVRT